MTVLNGKEPPKRERANARGGGKVKIMSRGVQHFQLCGAALVSFTPLNNDMPSGRGFTNAIVTLAMYIS